MTPSTIGRRVLAGAAVTATVLAVTTLPAQANDHTMSMSYNGDVVAVATWDDSIDTLCIRVTSPGSDDFAQVGILPVDGQPEPERDPRVASTTRAQGRYCTPNLKIREDVKYEMVMQWRDRLSSPTVIKNSRSTFFFS